MVKPRRPWHIAVIHMSWGFQRATLELSQDRFWVLTHGYASNILYFRNREVCIYVYSHPNLPPDRPTHTWMHPSANSMARALLVMSAPMASVRTTEKPVSTLPAAITFTCVRD